MEPASVGICVLEQIMGVLAQHWHRVEAAGCWMPALAVGTCDTGVRNDETPQHRAATSWKQTV